MDNKQLTKLANTLVTKRREKRAFLGGLARIANLLAKGAKGAKGAKNLLPRAAQMAKESPKAYSAMNEGNLLKMLSSARMPGMKAPPLPPNIGRANIRTSDSMKRLQRWLAKMQPQQIEAVRGIPGAVRGVRPPNVPAGSYLPKIPSRPPPPPPITPPRVPNPNFRPKSPGSSMFRSPGMGPLPPGPPSPFSRPM